MSKDVEERKTSELILDKAENLLNPAACKPEKTPNNSTQSSKCSFTSYSRTCMNNENDSDVTSSRSSTKSRDRHYISLVQPRSASCSVKSIRSDEIVQPEENLEYAWKLEKEMSHQNSCLKLNEEVFGSTNSTAETCIFDEIPLTTMPEKKMSNASSKQNRNKLSKEVDLDSLPRNTNRTSARKITGPRMTTSDSIISINKKYLQDSDRKCNLPTEAEVEAWEKPSSSEKPAVVTVLNKSNAESEQTSSLTPVSIFENEKYKTFTDSNSHDDDILESIKSASCRKKSMTGKVDFKKGIELKNSSLLSIPSTVCRICHTNTANERLLSPCYCKGSLAYVHLSCLERWLNQSSRSYCELCLYQYNAVETLRYGFFEGIRLWIRHPRNRNHVRSDCLIAFLLTLVTFGLVVICFIGMDYFMIEGIKLGLSRMWTKSFIVSFLGVIMMGYVVTMYLIAKDQFVPWYTWWKNTLNIRLLLSPTVMQTQRI